MICIFSIELFFKMYKLNNLLYRSNLLRLIKTFLYYQQTKTFQTLIIYQFITMTQPLKKVGPYRLWRGIGSGATSQVFEATKQSDIQKYAIKMIRLGKITENQKLMIHKEVSIIKSISHPHIVKLHQDLQTTNNFYLVFQYCQKGDLEKYLKKYYGPMVPEDTVQKIIFCIGDALREIHSKGIVHRDIKLANILLKKQFNGLVIKLADFGFAKQINEQEFMLKTYCGTPITMAPQILQNEYYDKKCDIWSLGIIMYQLVYGKLPFAINEGYNKFVQRVIKETVRIPSQPQMPQQFKELLMRCLEKNPEKRCSIDQFMCSQWILQGKDKKLDERKQQIQAQLTKIVKQISHDFVDNDNEQQIQQRERNQIIEMNTAQRVYKLLRNQMEKIVECHHEVREEIFQRINRVVVQNGADGKVVCEYGKLVKLLEFLDFKYLNFLKELKITVTKGSAEISIKLQDINNLVLPQYLYIIKTKDNNQKPPQNILIGETISNFLHNLSETDNDTLQRKRQRYILVERFLSMFRRYELSLDILFVHHDHRQQICLQNVLKEFKQMGKHVSESMIQQAQKSEEESKQGQKNQKYDALANFITLSIEYRERDEKLKQFRESLKFTCERGIDEVSKAIQGYYN